MNQIELQESGIKALRAFNSAITTSRLYPPTAPQVGNAIEYGFKGVHHFLKRHGDLVISLQDGDPFLGDLVVDQETLASFSNLVVYRQMEVLGVSRLVLQPSMDRFAFGQILSVFNAKPAKIQKDGGAIEFITSLGLISYFPEPDPVNVNQGGAEKEKIAPPLKPVNVEADLLSCLTGQDDRPEIKAKLRKSFKRPDKAVDILVAAIGLVLRELQKKRGMSRSELFPHILKSTEELLPSEECSQVALELGRVLVNSLKEPVLCVVLSQDYPDGFGRELYDAQVTLIDTKKLGNIIVLLRKLAAKTQSKDGTGDSNVRFVDNVLSQLIVTEKGKQFLGAEKAREVLLKGEEERKKQRIQSGIRGITQGDFTYLQSTELLEHLPDVVRGMVGVTDGLHLDAFLHKLVNQLHTGGEDSQSHLLKMLASVTENFILDRHWYYVDVLLDPLLEWVRCTEESEEPFARIVTLLQVSMQHYWKSGKKSQGDTILTLFHRIRSGDLQKSPTIAAIVGRVQDRGIQRTSFPELLTKWLADPYDAALSTRLVRQGPVAVRFLVESLITTEDSDHRYKILDLLIRNDHFLPEILLERLHEHMVWYGKRNLLKLLAETGGEEDAETVLPYFSHEDFRVQRGAFICVNKIGGKNRKRLFLAALTNSSELIKVQIIKALARFCDPDVVGHLAKLLDEYESFSKENREQLLMQIFDTLGKCSCPNALKAVDRFLKMRGQRGTRKVPSAVWSSAEKAMEILEQDQRKMRKLHVQANQLRKNAIRQAVKSDRTPPSKRVISGLAEEQAIRILLNKGEEEKARVQLVELIEQIASTRNFVQAEKLKEWLIDINATALGDIIRAAEIISDKKEDALDRTHIEVWPNLYDSLSTEEFDCLYKSLQHKKYSDEEIVVNQGSLQTALYFINSGKLKLFYQDRGNRMLVKTLEQGEIVGTSSFFDASVWTISVASVGTSELSILRLEKMQQWQNECPGLESKLYAFCAGFKSIGEILKKSAQDRRIYERHRITGRVAALLLDNFGKTTGVSSDVDLFDISEGGISYFMKLLRKENGRLMLGRKVKVMLPGGRKPGQQVALVGDILAVRDAPDEAGDYSVHVKFETPTSSLQLKEIVLAAQREAQVSR